LTKGGGDNKNGKANTAISPTLGPFVNIDHLTNANGWQLLLTFGLAVAVAVAFKMLEKKNCKFFCFLLLFVKFVLMYSSFCREPIQFASTSSQ
jgi:hypothetical protein